MTHNISIILTEVLTMGYDKKAVGAEIRRRRLALGLTQEKAAEKIDRALRFYARIELGDVGMSVDTLLEICGMLWTRCWRSVEC